MAFYVLFWKFFEHKIYILYDIELKIAESM